MLLQFECIQSRRNKLAICYSFAEKNVNLLNSSFFDVLILISTRNAATIALWMKVTSCVYVLYVRGVYARLIAVYSTYFFLDV